MEWREPLDCNIVLLIGRVVDAPTTPEAGAGTGVLARFLISTRRRYVDSQQIRHEVAALVVCCAWGALGSLLIQDLRPGAKVMVRGRVDDAPNGVSGCIGSRSQVVIVEQFDLLAVG